MHMLLLSNQKLLQCNNSALQFAVAGTHSIFKVIILSILMEGGLWLWWLLFSVFDRNLFSIFEFETEINEPPRDGE